MNRFRNYVLMAAGFAVLVMVVGVFSAGPAIAQAVRAALVSNVDDPGPPYQITSNCYFNGSNICHASLPSVLAGKRLVITQVSGHIKEDLPGGTLLKPMLSAGFSDYDAVRSVEFLVAFQGNDAGLNYFLFNQAVTIFVDPGQRPKIDVVMGGESANPLNLTVFTLTGYMLDCTTGPCAAIAP